MKEILHAVSQWSVGDEPTTWINLLAMANKGLFVINQGRGGLSKSHCSTRLARTLHLATEDVDTQGNYTSPVVVFNGRQSPLGFYQFLNRYRDRVIIFDDITSFRKDQMGMLKDICGESHITAWQTYNSPYDSFEFTGSVIINSNTEVHKYNQDLDAIRTRAYVSDFYLRPLELARKRKLYWMQKQKKISINLEIWRDIRNRIITLSPQELTIAEIKRIADWATAIPITHSSVTNMRDEGKLEQFFKLWKGFWGKLTDEVFNEGFKIMTEFYAHGQARPESEVLETIKEYLTLNNTDTVQRIVLRDILCNKYSISRATAQRYISTSLDEEEIELGRNERYLMIKQKNYKPQIIIKPL
jgi:hypothetical protein